MITKNRGFGFSTGTLEIGVPHENRTPGAAVLIQRIAGIFTDAILLSIIGDEMAHLQGKYPMKYSENDYNERYAECLSGESISHHVDL